jgi:hypothetical protein
MEAVPQKDHIGEPFHMVVFVAGFLMVAVFPADGLFHDEEARMPKMK